MPGVAAKHKGMHGEYEVRDILQKEIDLIYATWNEQVVEGLEPPVKINVLAVPQLRRNTTQSQGKYARATHDEASGFDLAGLDWMAIEVKRQENASNLNQWWEQCKSSAVNETGEYVKEPVLIWRQNYMPWRVRMFGYLVVVDVPGGSRIRGPVDIQLQMFLAYFRERVRIEMASRIKCIECD